MIARAKRSLRRYGELDRRIWMLAGVRAVNTMGLALAMAFMAIYLVDDRGLSASAYGAIYLVANLVQSFAQGYAGELSDLLGRRGIMTSALVARAGVMAVIGLEVLADSPIALIAATLVVSATLRGCFEPVAYAMVADVAAPERRVAAYGLQRMGTNLGWAIGPAAGGLLAQVIHYGYVFFVTAGFLVAAAVVTAGLTDPARPGKSESESEGEDAPRVSLIAGVREALARADTALLLCCSLLFALVHVQLFSTLSVYGAAELDLSKADLGIAYAVNGATVLLLQLPAVGAISRFGIARALVTGSLLYAAAYLGVGVAAGLPALAGFVFVLTLGEILVAPAQQAAAAAVGDQKRMGRAFGLLGLAQMLGVSVAPLIGGVLFDLWRGEPLVLWGAVALVAAGMAYAHRRLGRHLS